jgi:FkbM family methyltransferase
MKLNKAKILGKYIFYYLADDKYVGQRVALGKYEPYETELMLRQASAIGGQAGCVVVDVGANIGYYTILLADKVGKKGKVYAFEPDSTSFDILEKNIKANKLENVVAIKAAAGSREGKLELYKSEENLGDHKLYGKGKKEIVKVIRLDDFIKEKVDLIKIDTQGWEPEVIEGAKEIIKKWKPVMFLEYSPASYRAAKLDGKKMMEFCKAEYKRIFWIDEWLYIYKVLNIGKIEQICRTNKTGYADLWLKKNISFKDYFDCFRDLKIKKWVKKKLFRI